MRIVFMGTPAFAVPALDALVDAGHDIAAVYSQPPRPAGRGKKPRPSPVHLRAEELGIEVRTPASLKGDTEKADFASLAAEVAVVAAYGLILNREILEAPQRGCLNIHASLLPRWRGAAPVQRAILAGDMRTGVTIMQMERGLDTGPMLATRKTPVDRKTAGELTQELADLGAALIVDVLADLSAYDPEAQDGGHATYASKLDKAEARLDFSEPAAMLERAVRAFNPMPGAFFEHEGERFKVLTADIVDESGAPGAVIDDRLTIACGERALRPTLVQRAGKSAMNTEDLLRGFPIPEGTILS
ncbi:methionyl-tRNA formyltransferase [Parasphingopyxis marina]|uniref:Methionyl-tRNA formyltransferase n=1 Tax=Parasphingopyxis marina TaxID=2761622 RepID=A0A842HZG0_9SPHN|nr:methionyl-tRNA formyltransferase [Parasphingopyxis marina]MBC2777917.1 methionyl-tRNA formyltransferase [Parasphingopyxis marina]